MRLLRPVTLLISLLSSAFVTFAQQGTIAGTVVDTTGSSVAVAQVRLLLDGRAPAQETKSADNGTFSFANVPPGPYHLSFVAKGFAAKTIDGELHAGEALSLPPTVLSLDRLTTEVNVTQTQVEIAEVQIKTEEQQRLLGVLPQFFVAYDHDAVPLTTKQKAELSWKNFTDPFSLIANGIGAGVDQARNTNKGFGQGAQGYAKRYGASYADFVTSLGMDRFVFRTLFKQDPRYFVKGTGSKASRFEYAISRSVVCRGDNKKAQLCYSSILSEFGTGFLTNYYYPRADRNTNAQLLQGGAISLGANMGINLFHEFVAKKITFKVPCLLWACPGKS